MLTLCEVCVSVPDPWHFGPDLDPRIQASDKWIRIQILLFKKSFSAYYYLKVHLRHFLKIKSLKEVTKQ